MGPQPYLLRKLVLVTILLSNPYIWGEARMKYQRIEEFADISNCITSVASGPKELIVLEEYIRPGMRFGPTMRDIKGGCMLKIQKLANNDGTQVHYAIAGYAVDKVDDQWIWHNHLSNSVRYDGVKGVYTAFVSGIGNVYFSI